jgi:thiol:disulfide interchange protein DsbC
LKYCVAYRINFDKENRMKRLKLMLITGCLATIPFVSLADDTTDKLKIKTESLLKTEISSITESPVKGLYEVMTERGPLYLSSDGRFMIKGAIYDLDNELQNLTEQSIAKLRKAKIEKYADSMIVFPAKEQQYQVTVFTDVSCGYCRRLHAQMAQYNEQGITIRYLAFPRGGERSSAWQEMQSLWCSKDQQKAMNDAQAGKKIAAANCDNPVAEHYQLGRELGVNGTPALVLDDGTMLPGYQPPEQLKQIVASR